MSAFATYHSINRAKERKNLKNQRVAERNIVRAVERGKRAEDFTSWERDFLEGECKNDCVAVAYNGFCYIVNSQDVCLTLYPLPSWFGKKKRFDGKERIRDYKKYQKHYFDNDDEEFPVVEDSDSPKEDGYMSRDWTLREIFEFEREMIESGMGSILDNMRASTFSYKEKTWPQYSEEEMSAREQFPLFGRLLVGEFPKLYERLSKYENGLEFLKLQDLELSEYIATGNYNPDSYLVKWFNGQLDKNFHYRERNNELLIERVCEEAMLHTGEQYDAYMEYRLDWYQTHGVSEADIAKFKSEYSEDVKEGRFDGTFHQYELEFGYQGGQIYIGFDEFLDNEHQQILESFDSLNVGDYVDVIINDCCDGLAKVLEVNGFGLRLEMVDGKYAMIYPNTELESNPLDITFDELSEISVVDPEKYKYGSFPESFVDVLESAKVRAGRTAHGNEIDQVKQFEKE